MNRIEFNLFIKKTFDAKYNQGRQEWRFHNGDRTYTLTTGYEANRSTYEPHLDTIVLYEREGRSGENAADDVSSKSSANVKYKKVDSLIKDRIGRDELRSWIVKAIVTHEFGQC